MRKETITYTDYNGLNRTEDFYFNLTSAELTDLQLGIEGGMAEKLRKIEKAKDVPAAIKFFKELIFKSYGEKSDDGRRFIKSEQLSTEFSQTEAYSILYMNLVENPEAANEFLKELIPADLAKKAEEMKKEHPEMLN